MKCVYCGKEFSEGGKTIKVSNGTFDVCSLECRDGVKAYLEADEKYKNTSYILIFCGSIGFILSTFIFTGRYQLVPMYIGMIIMGMSLVVLPYVFTSFITFTRIPVKKATLGVRIVGLLIAGAALAFLVATLKK